MNKVILMGRLTRDPEVRYSNNAEPLAIARYSLAINKRFKRDGEPDADFINCVSFGKAGEFAEKYFKKGQMVSVVGRLQVNSWEDQNGQKRYATDVVVEEQYFAESRKSFEQNNSYNSAPQQESQQHSQQQSTAPTPEPTGFSSVSEPADDDLPF